MRRRFWLLLIINIILVSTFVYGQSEDIDTKKVIVFHSYHNGLEWTDDLQEGIHSSLDDSNIELYIEYMDSYRFSGDEHKENLLAYYKSHYKEIEPDVIVVTDNFAFDFMAEYYDVLFEDVPIVFAGINNFEVDQIFEPKTTGIVQSDNHIETIELISDLHPNANRVIFIGGNNPTSVSEAQAFAKIGKAISEELVFEELINDNVEEQIQQLINVEQDTVLVIAGTIKGEDGTFYDHSKYSGKIIDETGLPVYAMASSYVNGTGAVGGYVVTPFDEGVQVGLYIKGIINGESIDNFPIIEEPVSYYMFNYKRLKQFGIERSQLPQGYQLLNLPERSMKIDQVYVVIYLVAAVALILIILFLFINISKRKDAEIAIQKQNEVLHHMAFHDPITNLYNRKYLVEYLQKHLLEPEHHFTAFYDVDIINFKMINDTYGYEVGSKVLKSVSSILRKTFKSDKECVGVYQSQFLIVDSEVVSKQLAYKKAQHLTAMIAKTIIIESMEIDIKVNVGISVAPDHTMDSKQLIKKANIALIESMKVGPNNVKIFEDTLYRDVLKRITLEKELRRALVNNEFVLYYQPKIHMKSMKVCGCEALIRWNHPDGRLIYPNEFIPLAEEVGLIEDIGHWVVNESTSQIKKWYDEGYEIKVSINASGREFDDDFIRNIKRVIETVGVEPKLLEVEITETAALSDLDHSRMLVQTLHDIGLSVSLDDFGTGYSSMTYIKQLKASKLKIDKTFIDDLENYEQKVVVDSMIQLGKKLDYIINVEGVETKEQLRILKYLGVDEVQGWYFSKALPSMDFINYVRNLDKNMD